MFWLRYWCPKKEYGRSTSLCFFSLLSNNIKIHLSYYPKKWHTIMKTDKTSRQQGSNSPSRIAEFLNSMLLMKSNEDDLYDSLFSNIDASVFLKQNNTDSCQDNKRNSKRFEVPLNVVTEDIHNNASIFERKFKCLNTSICSF